MDKFTEEYYKYFTPFNKEYINPERQAEQFKIISLLENVQTIETQNSIYEIKDKKEKVLVES